VIVFFGLGTRQLSLVSMCGVVHVREVVVLGSRSQILEEPTSGRVQAAQRALLWQGPSGMLILILSGHMKLLWALGVIVCRTFQGG